MDKTELRKQVLAKRETLSFEEEVSMNEAIFPKVIILPCFEKAKTVYCYVNFRHEAGTGMLLEYFWKKGIRAAVPKVNGRNLDFYFISSFDDLEKGSYGILEPTDSCKKAEDPLAPVIVPGVAFTRSGKRLGYGGGYYDRFFEKEMEHVKIAIAFDFQIVEDMIALSHDISMDYVITPQL